MIESQVIRGRPSAVVEGAVDVFRARATQLSLARVSTIPHVLDEIRPGLVRDGWECSAGKRSAQGVTIGRTSRDLVRGEARHPTGVALWIELGRSWTNYGFLQHTVEAAMIPEVSHAVLAVRHRWDGRVTYDRCLEFLLDVEDSAIDLPIESMTLVGF